MKYFFSVIVFVHALIHLLGFVKGFDLKDIKELSLPISKQTGLVWLGGAILFLIYGILYFINNRYSWLLGFIAIVLSQILIILFWKDAKYGTILNSIILIVSIISYGQFNFQKMIQTETAKILSETKTSNENLISENEIQDLPEPVKNWLRNSGAVDKSFINIGKVTQHAEMKLKPEQENWMSATAIQYTTIENPAFIWTVDVKMNSLLNVKGRDKFEDGKGEMLIKLNSLLPIVNEQGEKLNEGTIQRYLGEMVWFPSLAISPYVSWEHVNDSIAIASMEYKGTKGSGTFYFNSEGDFIRFSAMRFMGNEVDSKRHEWVLLADDYKVFEGIKVPAKMTATWKLPEGDWTWLKLEITDIKYNDNARR